MNRTASRDDRYVFRMGVGTRREAILRSVHGRAAVPRDGEAQRERHEVTFLGKEAVRSIGGRAVRGSQVWQGRGKGRNQGAVRGGKGWLVRGGEGR